MLNIFDFFRAIKIFKYTFLSFTTALPHRKSPRIYLIIISGGQFFFRVKFYVSDPSKLQEEYTRYQFYLQIRRDIMQGKLQLPVTTACLIASYTVQSELGDYHPEEHGPGYLTRLQLIPGQTEDMEKKICELHKLHK